MNALRPKTHLERLHHEMMRLVADGQDLPPLPVVAEKLGVSAAYLYGLLDRGQQVGLWRLARAGMKVTAIHHPRGEWLIHCRFRKYRGEAEMLPRKCLRCRGSFVPAHRTNFICQECREFIARCAP